MEGTPLFLMVLVTNLLRYTCKKEKRKEKTIGYFPLRNACSRLCTVGSPERKKRERKKCRKTCSAAAPTRSYKKPEEYKVSSKKTHSCRFLPLP